MADPADTRQPLVGEWGLKARGPLRVGSCRSRDEADGPHPAFKRHWQLDGRSAAAAAGQPLYKEVSSRPEAACHPMGMRSFNVLVMRYYYLGVFCNLTKNWRCLVLPFLIFYLCVWKNAG